MPAYQESTVGSMSENYNWQEGIIASMSEIIIANILEFTISRIVIPSGVPPTHFLKTGASDLRGLV